MPEQAPTPAPLVVAAFNGKVFALGRNDGKRAWSFECKGGHCPRVLVQAGKVFVLEDSLVCLEYSTGRLLWRAAIPIACSYGTLLSDQDRIVIADAGEVAAFDTEHGQQLWHEPFKGEGLATVALAVPGNASQGDVSR